MHRQGKTREGIKTRCISAGIYIFNSSPPSKAANTQHPKAANTTPKVTCLSHLSTPAPETSSKVYTMGSAYLYPAGPNTIEPQWWYQNATHLFPILLTSILIGHNYHHRTTVAGPKLHTVNPYPSNLQPYLLHPSIMSDKNLFCDFMYVVKNFSTLRACTSRYNVHSIIIKNLLDEYEYQHMSRTRKEKEPLVGTNNQNYITRWAQERLGLNHGNHPYTYWELLTAC